MLDLAWHAIDERRGHASGVYVAECGHRLMATRLHDQPGGKPCQACAALQLARAGAATGTATCASGKQPYATTAGARDALLSTRIAAVLHDNTRRREQRCYLCPRCGHWHLTSSPPYAAGRRQDE